MFLLLRPLSVHPALVPLSLLLRALYSPLLRSNSSPCSIHFYSLCSGPICPPFSSPLYPLCSGHFCSTFVGPFCQPFSGLLFPCLPGPIFPPCLGNFFPLAQAFCVHLIQAPFVHLTQAPFYPLHRPHCPPFSGFFVLLAQASHVHLTQFISFVQFLTPCSGPFDFLDKASFVSLA